MNLHDTKQALLSDVLLHPDDDVRRLVYADFLEEYGGGSDQARAEFIRTQIEEVRTGTVVLRKGPLKGLTRQSSELMRGHGDVWREECPPLARRTRDGSTAYQILCVWNRGFVEGITLPLETFIQDAGVLFSHHPILSVRVTDAVPRSPTGGHAGWFSRHDFPAAVPERDELPGELWDLLEGYLWKSSSGWKFYDSSEDAVRRAHDSLDEACVRFGKIKRDSLWTSMNSGL